MTQRFDSPNVAATEAIGHALASRLEPDAVVLLDGDLGAGKTVLVRGLASGLGLDRTAVQSPTFTIVHEHGATPGTSARLIHVDLYRLEPEETESVGIDEMLAGPGLKAVEWSERLPTVPPRAVRIRLSRRDRGMRVIEIEDGPMLDDLTKESGHEETSHGEDS